MSILDELLKATKLQLPTQVTDKFWEKLVRAVADNGIVDNDAWGALSVTAQDWANSGMRAITARKSKARARAGGCPWTGDAKSLRIVPLAVPDVPAAGTWDGTVESLGIIPLTTTIDPAAPKTKPAPRKRSKASTRKKKPTRKKAAKKATKKKTAAKISAQRKASRQPRKTLRASAFRTGRCYSFVRRLVDEVTKLEECDPVLLLERFATPGVGLTVSGASTMMYDTIAVLRALRDLDMFAHPIVEDLAWGTGK